MPLKVLIVGASVRAAAFSAVRAGLQPSGIDLFADRDLLAVGPARRIEAADYPDGLERLADEWSPSPWMYTGGIENHPDLVDRIARCRPLWGNDGATLRAARDPFALADVLRRAGLPGPLVRAHAKGLRRDGSWLVKPIASSGGARVRLWDEDAGPPIPGMYYQERIAGPCLAAVYVGRRNEARLVGVTRQCAGRPGAMFAYTGSVGPWPIADEEREHVATLGDVLASAFGLVGLFGVDFVLHDGHPWPLEINPRYTASVEVLELALGLAFLSDHRRACESTAPIGTHSERVNRPRVVGKRIVFAPCRCRFVKETKGHLPDPGFALPRRADIPHPGIPFVTGEPVLTIFASAADLEACSVRLDRRQALWEERLRRWATEDA